MEIWKDINGYVGLYQVSNFGNFRSLDRLVLKNEKQFLIKGKIKKAWLNGRGYLQVTLYKDGVGKHLIAHRVVAQEFIYNTYGKPQVNHIDGDKTNNHVDNLEWVTNGENQKHAYKMGLNTGTRGKKFTRKNGKVER